MFFVKRYVSEEIKDRCAERGKMQKARFQENKGLGLFYVNKRDTKAQWFGKY
jgi:hypothetical protein